jgi:hypothetical protein
VPGLAVQDDTSGFGSPHGATGYGIADYWVYALTDNVSIGLRSEWGRDQNGPFVSACPGNLDFVNSEEGNAKPLGAGPGGSFGPGTSYYDETRSLDPYGAPVCCQASMCCYLPRQSRPCREVGRSSRA